MFSLFSLVLLLVLPTISSGPVFISSASGLTKQLQFHPYKAAFELAIKTLPVQKKNIVSQIEKAARLAIQWHDASADGSYSAIKAVLDKKDPRMRLIYLLNNPSVDLSSTDHLLPKRLLESREIKAMRLLVNNPRIDLSFDNNYLYKEAVSRGYRDMMELLESDGNVRKRINAEKSESVHEKSVIRDTISNGLKDDSEAKHLLISDAQKDHLISKDGSRGNVLDDQISTDDDHHVNLSQDIKPEPVSLDTKDAPVNDLENTQDILPERNDLHGVAESDDAITILSSVLSSVGQSDKLSLDIDGVSLDDDYRSITDKETDDDLDLNNNHDEQDWVQLELLNMDEWVNIDPNVDSILFK